jgi:hypothetical protein
LPFVTTSLDDGSGADVEVGLVIRKLKNGSQKAA